jgi:hypothetical protein
MSLSADLKLYSPFLLPLCIFRCTPSFTLLLALVASLCNNALRSQTPLLPSVTAISSLATLSANFTSLRFADASKIHCIDCRLRCRILRGCGMGCIAPPPSIPRCWRILINGAMPSIAAVRYCIGERGRASRGVPAASRTCRSGCARFIWGAGAVRRVFKMWAISYTPKKSVQATYVWFSGCLTYILCFC